MRSKVVRSLWKHSSDVISARKYIELWVQENANTTRTHTPIVLYSRLCTNGAFVVWMFLILLCMYNCVQHFVHALTPLPILSNCLPCTVHESDACQSQLIAEWAKAVGTDPNLPVLRSKAEVLVVLTNSSECMFVWKQNVLDFFVF